MNRIARSLSRLILVSLLTIPLVAQYADLKDPNPKRRIKATKQISENNRVDPVSAAPALGELLSDPDLDVRRAAIVALIKIGSQHSLPPLQRATHENSSDLQSLAVDGMVNFYYPGYINFGWINSVSSFGKNMKSRFSKPAPQIIDLHVEVSPDVVSAITPLIGGGSSMESRANAARAVGILRARAATPQLVEGLKSKDSTVILECVRAIEKIGDTSVGPDIVFLLRDLDPKVQRAVVETSGQLRVKEAVPELTRIIRETDNKGIRRQALIALAKIPDNGQGNSFKSYLRDKDKQLRAAAAEGIARGGTAEDLPLVQELFTTEKSESARLSLAFAAVNLGDMSRLSYLIDGLNSTVHRMEARPFLVELARKPEVLAVIHERIGNSSKDQKIHLAYVLSISGTSESIPHLEELSRGSDTRAAQAAITALQNLRVRL